LLARFNAEIDPILDQTRPDRDYLNPVISFFYGDSRSADHGRGGAVAHLRRGDLCHPFYTDVCDAVLGRIARAISSTWRK
jgi:hypothetical protein